MSRVATLLLLGTLAGLVPAAAEAQSRVPDTGLMAAGGELGVFLPAEEFGSALVVGGLFEYYLTPRLGLRGSLSRTNPEFDRGTDDALRQLRLGFDVIYNWERGRWHPFVGGGLGIHFLDLRENGRPLDDRNDLGLNLLGGAEYFFNRRTTVKFEGRLQFVDDAPFGDPSGVALTVGLKRYF